MGAARWLRTPRSRRHRRACRLDRRPGKWRDHGAGAWFFVAYFAILLFNGVIFLVVAALELALVGDELIWQAPVRGGSIRTDDLRFVRPFGPFGVLAVVGTASGPRALVWATAGFADFMEAVVAAAPHVKVRHGSYQRTGDWLAGRPRR